MSLEFLTPDFTYWLVSGAGFPDFSFIKIPKNFFDEGFKLKGNELFKEQDYSEIIIYQDGDDRKYLFSEGQESGANGAVLDLVYYENLSWNECFIELTETKWLGDLSAFWHNQIVEKSDDCQYDIHSVRYVVTAFLPPDIEPVSAVFAIRGEDYQPPDNPNWITFNELNTKELFLSCLSNFRVDLVNFKGHLYKV